MDCNLKTTKLLDHALTGVYVVNKVECRICVPGEVMEIHVQNASGVQS